VRLKLPKTLLIIYFHTASARLFLFRADRENFSGSFCVGNLQRKLHSALLALMCIVGKFQKLYTHSAMLD